MSLESVEPAAQTAPTCDLDGRHHWLVTEGDRLEYVIEAAVVIARIWRVRVDHADPAAVVGAEVIAIVAADCCAARGLGGTTPGDIAVGPAPVDEGPEGILAPTAEKG